MLLRKLIASVALAAAASGCFSVDVESSPVLGEGVERHVTVENYGWYLFGCVPLFCGNKNLDSWCPVSFFCDEVLPPIAYDKLKNVARRENCDIVDLHVIFDDDVLFEAYYVSIPWIVVYKEVSLSACLVKKGDAQ